MASLQASAVETLKGGFRGEVLAAGDAGYDDARAIWNGMFDRRPAVIARCVGAHDVIQAVGFARENDLAISVKGGGHGVAGFASSEGGMMVDLSLMRGVTVDPARKTARVEGGALLGDADAGTQLHGLAVSAGVVSHTGVAGLTLGGGFGWISRKHGFTIDNLLSAQVVTADGRLVTASEKENPDLFWGIRGGGGNFGIVTSFEFKGAEIGTQVYSGMIVKKFEDAKRYIQFHREYVRNLPDEATVWMVIRHAPPLPFLPEEIHGKMVVVVPFVILDDPAKGEEMIRPIREFSEAHGEMIGMHPWSAWQQSFDPLVDHGARNYWKSHHLMDLSDGCTDAILEWAGKMPSPECEVFIPHMEGAPSRVPEEATAFAHRKTPFVMNIHTRWRDAADDGKCMEWARGIHGATTEYAKGVYVNFIADLGEEQAKVAYTPAVWERLVQTKRKWDPGNLFRMNQNIKP